MRLDPRWRWPLVAVLALALGSIGVWRACRFFDQSRRAASDTVRGLGQAVSDVAERFKSGRITTTFTAAIPRPPRPSLAVTRVRCSSSCYHSEPP